jgi:hypothetical protein
MKLQSTTGTLTVDYYPIQLPHGDVCEDWVLKVLKFQGTDTMSEKYVTKKQMNREVNERVGMGYDVIDFNVTPQYGNPMNGAC